MFIRSPNFSVDVHAVTSLGPGDDDVTQFESLSWLDTEIFDRVKVVVENAVRRAGDQARVVSTTFFVQGRAATWIVQPIHIGHEVVIRGRFFVRIARSGPGDDVK